MAKAKSKKGAAKAAPKAAAKPAAQSKAAKPAAPEAVTAVPAPTVEAGTSAGSPAAEPKPTREGLEAARADCGHGTPEGNRAVAKQALAEINALAAEAVVDGETALPRAEGAPVGDSPVAAAVLASAAELGEPCLTAAEPAPAEARRDTPQPMAGTIGDLDPESEANGLEAEDEPVAGEPAPAAPVLDAKAEAAGYAAEAVTADSETGPACDPADAGESVGVEGAVAVEAASEVESVLAETSVDAAVAPAEALIGTAAGADLAAAPDEALAEPTAPAGHVCQCKTLAEAPPLLQDNPYLPETATIIEVIDETPDVKTFRVVVDDAEKMKNFRFEPGQVGQLSVFGAGESTFVINSPPTRMEYLQFSVMRVGELTTKLHGLKAGDQVGVRAPLGNWFPYESMKGKDIVFIGGGIGLAPLRTLLLFMLDNRQDYGKITLVYGARNPALLCYKPELAEWAARGDMKVLLTVDQPSPDWTGKVGVVPNLLLEDNPGPDSIAVTCGPPIMIKFTIQALQKLKFPPENIITTLERRMKCGIGICGRCNIGGQFVCVDGPVFSYAELQKLPNEL